MGLQGKIEGFKKGGMMDRFSNASINTYLLIGAVVLNLLALLNVPYGYYNFLRFYNFIVAGMFAYRLHKKNFKIQFFLALIIAILYNPFAKIRFSKDVWTFFNLAVVSCSVFCLYNKKKLDVG